MNLKCIGIDIGHNLRCDVGAVGIRREDELNLLVGRALISKFKGVGIKVIVSLDLGIEELRIEEIFMLLIIQLCQLSLLNALLLILLEI